ncbi:putative 3'(2'),5'-bisphosphate nucleotidase, mitochondrial [Silene latifolia]|uniref:putative 3'(2'),5'-bisphosphate nucleotidase, mitochondrial n=1 Tax=Silene latifolia TaxID=37657 RepID=UPI003D77C016
MDLRYSPFRFSNLTSVTPFSSSIFRHSSSNFFSIRASLPVALKKAKYFKELEAAVNVVHKSCRICVDVQKSLLSDDRRVLEKNDNTPVTIADFSVQALISLELGKLFPSIPLVAEEDSAFLRSNNLANAVLNVVKDNTSSAYNQLQEDEVLQAIDRGGNNAVAFDDKPATYWVLDPIDGTRGFLKGGSAMYVVGLALIVEGEIVLGVMGCPKWRGDFINKSVSDVQGTESESGIIMAAHTGCGTWKMKLSVMIDNLMAMNSVWEKCFVNECSTVHEACFCIPESQTWDSLPLSKSFRETSGPNNLENDQIILLPTCCGSLCKYLTVASGRASIFILRSRTRTIIKAWDHAVGMICVHEAGGKVTDWNGSQIDLAADAAARRVIFPSGGILVSNGTLHGQILELICPSAFVVV